MSKLPPDPPDAVASARREIDDADREILRVLGRRFAAVRRIAALKGAEPGRAFFDEGREREILERWAATARGLELPEPFVQDMLREILRHSKRVQEPLMPRERGNERRRTRPRVAIQGIAASNSALAVTRLFATRATRGAEPVFAETFAEAVEALQEGRVDYALLPVENSISGIILDVHRLICDGTLHAVDEEVLVLRHVLAARPGSSLERILTVRSHPAALAQCTRFLRNTGLRCEPWFDTAGAAESLASAPESTAAICSPEAAELHGLDVLARDLADHDSSETRFLLLSTRAETPDVRLPCRTTVFFRLNHHEGALARILQVFAEHGANLLRIESRPQVDHPWEYGFLVDLEGHGEEAHLAEALRRARRYCNHLRVVGTYPRRARPSESRPRIAGPPRAARRPAPQPEAPPRTPALLTDLAPDRKRTTVRVGSTSIGPDAFTLIAGPCAVETREQVLAAAAIVRRAGGAILRGGAYKPRTSPYSFQGLGVEGLRYLEEAGAAHGLPVVTEVVRIENIPDVLAHADMIQVGARNMQNFPLLKELGAVDRPILLKRGMSATLKELLLAAEYILSAGNQQVVLCERGIRTFETATRSTLDLSAIPVLRRRTHLPIIVDPSHAAGDRELVTPLAVAAAAAGADGLIVETHPEPERALCDRDQALTPAGLEEMVEAVGAVLAAQGRAWR